MSIKIYERKDSKALWVRITFPIGEALRCSTGTENWKEAEAWAIQKQYEVWRERNLETKSQFPNNEAIVEQSPEIETSYLWEEAVARWCEESEHLATYDESLGRFRWFDTHLRGVALADITQQKIANIASIKAKQTSKATANRNMSLLRAVLRRAADSWQWIDKAPKVSMFKVAKRRVRFLTVAEADALAKRLPEHLRDMMLFTLATGLRKSNVTGLEWSQVNLEARKSWIHPEQAKAGDAIGTPLNENAWKVLERQRGKHHTRVFTYQGKPVREVNTKAWRKALRDVGIKDFRWHDLRHTWASWLAMKGATLSELQELGGWKSPEMVQRYAHLSTDHLARTSARLDDVMNLISI